MKRGSAFRIVGFVLGIVGTVVSVTAIVFSVVGLLLEQGLMLLARRFSWQEK